MTKQQTQSIQQTLFDYQKWENDLNRRDAERRHDAIAEQSTFLIKAAVDSSLLALRTSVIINGGAAIAVLGFIGALAAHQKIPMTQLDGVATTLIWFAAGAATAVGAMALSYVTNYFYGSAAGAVEKTWDHPYSKPTPSSERWQKWAVFFHIAALALGIASLVAFIWGMVDVQSAIAHIAPHATT